MNMPPFRIGPAALPGLVAVGMLAGSGCSLISGVDDLQKVTCVAACEGGTAGTEDAAQVGGREDGSAPAGTDGATRDALGENGFSARDVFVPDTMAPNDAAIESAVMTMDAADSGSASDVTSVSDASTSTDSQPDAPASADSQPADGPSVVDSGRPAPTGLLYYFPLAGDTKDYSGNGHNATNVGATLTTGHLGAANTAYNFNGTSNYMYASGASLPLGNAARTFMMWVRPNNGTTQ